MPTAAELVFRISTQGTSELDKVAITTKSVGEGARLAGAQLKTFDATMQSLVGGGKSYRAALEEMAASHGVLSASVRKCASDMLDQLKAAEGDEAAIRRLTGATNELVSANVAAGASMRTLEGAMPIRAAENFLTKVLGFGPVLQAAFPIFGAVALGEVVVTIGEKIYDLVAKWDPVTAAEKRAKDALEDYGKSVDIINKKLQDNRNREFRLKNGNVAADAAEADQLARAATEGPAHQAEILKSYLVGLKKELADALARPTPQASGADSSVVNMMRQRDIDEAKANVSSLETEIARLQLVAAGLKSDSGVKTTESLTGQKNLNEKDQTKSANAAAELKKRQAQNLIEAQKALAELQAKEILGVEGILAKRQAIYDTLAKDKTVGAAQLEVEKLITAELVKQYVQKLASDAITITDLSEEQQEKNRGRDRRSKIEDLLSSRDPHEFDDYNKNEEMLGRVRQRSSEAQEEDVRRRIATANREDRLANGKGGGATGVADRSYERQIDSTQKIFEIETATLKIKELDALLASATADKNLSLTSDQRKQIKDLANARKKAEDSLYSAREQHEDAIAEIQAQNLQKYEALSGKIFDAITNRQRGAGFELGQMLREAATSTGKQIFTNLTAPVLQQIGQKVAGVIPGQSDTGLGKILKGTIFDSANKVDPTTVNIRDYTKRTADATEALVSAATGKQTSGGSELGVDYAISALGGNPLADMTASVVSSLPAAITSVAGGSGSSATGILGAINKLVSGSGVNDLGTGVGAAISGDALSMVLGKSEVKDSAGNWNAATTGQRIGAGVGLGAELATGGLAIASGISQGGVKGNLGAAGAAAGTATALASNIAKLAGVVLPAAIPVIGTAVAALLPLIGSLFGGGPQQRQNQINTEIAKNQYLAPSALNVNQSMSGTYQDFDARGNIRESVMRALPTVAEPYVTSNRYTTNGGALTYYDAPGNVTSPYSGGATGTGQTPVSNAPPLIVQIHAIDTQSGVDFLLKNHGAIGDALTHHLNSGNGQRAAAAIRFHAG